MQRRDTLTHVAARSAAPTAAVPDATAPDMAAPDVAAPAGSIHLRAEDGSLVTEYGLVAVLGATIAGLAIKWASGGAIFELLGVLLTKVRVLVGA